MRIQVEVLSAIHACPTKYGNEVGSLPQEIAWYSACIKDGIPAIPGSHLINGVS